MDFFQIKGSLDYMISLLKGIERHTKCASCGGDAIITSAGVDTSIPAGFKSITIVKTSDNSDSVLVEMSDSSIYPITEQFEVFEDAASPNGVLPAYDISGDGTWKWHGIK
jgi:hypothetical protein